MPNNRQEANKRKRRSSSTSSGTAVDSQGDPAVDPTKNVVALNEAASKRQDDLRELTNDLTNAKLLHLTDIVALRAEHAKEITELESNRLNAIRQVDVLAVSTAADRAAAAISALAATTATNAENLRNALTATAATIATQSANTVAAIIERISALEKSSYEGKGKQAVSDPMVAELVSEMKSLREAKSINTGKSEGISVSWSVLISLIATMTAIVTAIYAIPRFGGGNTAAPAAAPQVIYVPVPDKSMMPVTVPTTTPQPMQKSQ